MTGLSPRVRGNLERDKTQDRIDRSIPACAGEPATVVECARMQGVYPRVCGGTGLRQPPTREAGGLSPRVRGNHEGPGPVARRLGSIPACAGEPGNPSRWLKVVEVYPRVCGGTTAVLTPAKLVMGLSPRVRGNRATWAQT